MPRDHQGLGRRRLYAPERARREHRFISRLPSEQLKIDGHDTRPRADGDSSPRCSAKQGMGQQLRQARFRRHAGMVQPRLRPRQPPAAPRPVPPAWGTTRRGKTPSQLLHAFETGPTLGVNERADRYPPSTRKTCTAMRASFVQPGKQPGNSSHATRRLWVVEGNWCQTINTQASAAEDVDQGSRNRRRTLKKEQWDEATKQNQGTCQSA